VLPFAFVLVESYDIIVLHRGRCTIDWLGLARSAIDGTRKSFVTPQIL